MESAVLLYLCIVINAISLYIINDFILFLFSTKPPITMTTNCEQFLKIEKINNLTNF
jgi:hypothetical protein